MDAEKRRDRRSAAVKARSADKHRDYNNRKTFGLLDEVMQIFRRNCDNLEFPYDISIISKGRQLLTSGKFAALDDLVIEMKSAELNLSLKLATENEVSEFEECTPLADRVYEMCECIDVSPNTFVDICIKSDSTRPNISVCDLVTCTDCVPYPEGKVPVFEQPTGVCIYSGPGNGKTLLIESLPVEYRSAVVDTDHLVCDEVPPRSVVFTNRPDVLSAFPGIRVFHMPHREVWLSRCGLKVSQPVNTWYDDAREHCIRAYVMRSDKYLSELIDLRYSGKKRKRLK